MCIRDRNIAFVNYFFRTGDGICKISAFGIMTLIGVHLIPKPVSYTHLEAKKKDVLTPKKRKPRKSKADQIKLLVRQAQKSGMKLDEIADKLGMALPE